MKQTRESQQSHDIIGQLNQALPLADWQSQLFLLEQQNKKRLLMARQEQDPREHQIPGHHIPDPRSSGPHMAKAASSNVRTITIFGVGAL
jgi:hypothetical protein